MAVENIQHNTFIFTFPINNSIKRQSLLIISKIFSLLFKGYTSFFLFCKIFTMPQFYRDFLEFKKLMYM